ncbi:MAG: 4Fe-4S binding protein [Thermodesulfobacteriota bacterium]
MRETPVGNWKRRVSQLGFLVILGEFSFYGVFRCPFAVPYVSCGNCPVLQCPGRDLWIPVWVGLLVSGLIFGRAFCGWACPGGLVSELLGKIALFKGKVRNSVESISKYPVVVASLVVFFLLNNPRWAIPIRTGEFLSSVSLTFEHADQLWLWRTGFIIGGLSFALIIPHFWCRYLCPTGGLLELLSRISFLRYLKTSACNECDSCRRSCFAETRPAEINCTNCGDCRDVCPINAITLAHKEKDAEQEARTA